MLYAGGCASISYGTLPDFSPFHCSNSARPRTPPPRHFLPHVCSLSPSLSFSLFLPSCFPSLIHPLKALSPSQLRIWWWFPSSRQRPLCSLVGSHLRIKFHIQFCSNPLLPPILSEQAGPVSFFVYFSFIPTISPSVLCVLFFKPSPPFQPGPSCQLVKVPPLLLLSTPPTSSFSLPTYQPSVPHTFAVMIQLITSTAHITHLHCV